MGKRKANRRMEKGKTKLNTTTSTSDVVAPPWIELPSDLTANILQRLDSFELLKTAQKVCTTWRSICADPAMWRVIDLEHPLDMGYDQVLVCQHAVDRSQGQLVDINIPYFGTNELLDYICPRSSQLRRLKIECCYFITGKRLNEALKHLPQLEELHLRFMNSVNANDVEAMGYSCPMLKIFTYTSRISKFTLPKEGDDCAMAIAKSMPALIHLHLLGNALTNEGLKAILDGCPRLETLDIRKCYMVDLDGDLMLGRRCSQQLKHLKYPSEATTYQEWWNTDSDFDDVAYSSDYDYNQYSLEDYEYYTDPLGYGYDSDENGLWLYDI